MKVTKQIQRYWRNYRERHRACPKCRSLDIGQTTAPSLGLLDLNSCWCDACKWRGCVDDLLPAKPQ